MQTPQFVPEALTSDIQTASITAALPFSVIMIFMTIGLIKSLREEVPGPAYAEAGAQRVTGGLDT